MTSPSASLSLAPSAAPRPSKLWAPAIVLVAAAAAGPMLSPYLSDLAMRLMVLAILALSLELLVGMTGLVSLGHAAFFGIGAYATALGPALTGGTNGWLLPLAMVAAAIYALFVGALSLRTRGVYFIMVTLAFAQMAFYVAHDTSLGGGSDGVYLMSRPTVGPIDLENRTQLFYVILASLAATYGFLALLARSRFGAALRGIRINEQRMRAAGYSTYAYQLAAFVIAGALAGLAGFLFAARDGVVNPEMMAWHASGEILVMIILGGLGHLRGAVIGAAAFTLLKELFSTYGLVGPLAEHWQLTLGLSIMAFVALLPDGLIALWARMSPKEAS